MATSTSTVIKTRQQGAKVNVQAVVRDDNDQVDESPRPLQRASTIHNPSPGFSHRHRHSKKLSLNFPIIPVPIAYDPTLPLTANGSTSSLSHSPSVASPYRNGTPTSGLYSHVPLPSPNELRDLAEGPDFLTLIAGQERRVMELKEELQKAETELLGLKKQWSVFERRKKQAELRNKTVRTGPVSPKSAAANGRAETDEVERLNRKEAKERERKIRELAIKEAAAGVERLGSNASGGVRGKGGRVFAGRHTRTLSLLQSANTTSPTGSEGGDSEVKSQPGKSDTSMVAGPGQQSESSARRQSRASISKQPTLQELISTSATGAAQMNFGKTYKDLAQAGRKSLPPGTDELVKQGKQVYDGINQGFWNFVEDIRQATVGDEPVNGPAPVEHRREGRPRKISKKLAKDESCDRHHKQNGRGDAKKKTRNGDDHKTEKDTFWKEFGLETPKNSAKNGTKLAVKNKENQSPVKDHESKSSTDSKCPPSLLDDLMDVHDDDETWDNWPVESPKSRRQAEQAVNIRNTSTDDNDTDEEGEDNGEDAQVAKSELVSRMQVKKPMETSWAELTS